MRVSWLSQCNRMSHAFFERDAGVDRKPPVPSPSFPTIALHITINLDISDKPFVLTLRTNAWINTVVLGFILFLFSVLFEATAATYAFSITFAGVYACCDREHLISHCNLHRRFIYYPVVLTEAVGLLTLGRHRGGTVFDDEDRTRLAHQTFS